MPTYDVDGFQAVAGFGFWAAAAAGAAASIVGKKEVFNIDDNADIIVTNASHCVSVHTRNRGGSHWGSKRHGLGRCGEGRGMSGGRRETGDWGRRGSGSLARDCNATHVIKLRST